MPEAVVCMKGSVQQGVIFCYEAGGRSRMHAKFVLVIDQCLTNHLSTNLAFR